MRPKLSLRCCDRIVQVPAPSRGPSTAGWPGPDCWLTCWSPNSPITCRCTGRSEIYEREGVELERSTLAELGRGESRVLAPLVDARAARYVLDSRQAARRRHAGAGAGAGQRVKTKTGRLWTYVRDDRPAGDTAAPAVWFALLARTARASIRRNT